MKKILSLILTAFIACGLIFSTPLTAGASTVASGTCGDNATWVLDSNGTLTISGTGAMSDYTLAGKNSVPTTPWYDKTVTSAIIENGITYIGNCAFYGLSDLISVNMADSVTSVGSGIFYSSGVKNIRLSNNLALLLKQ